VDPIHDSFKPSIDQKVAKASKASEERRANEAKLVELKKANQQLQAEISNRNA